MIRINLLPYREIAKKETQTKQIIIIAGAFLVFVLILGGVQLFVWGSIGTLEERLKDREARLVQLDKIIGEVDQYKKEKQLLEKKLGIINTLEQNRTYPVRMLADIASQVPVQDVWLEKLSQGGGGLAIEGKARDNFAVVRFMKNLEGSMYVKSVDLITSKQVDISGIKLQQFTLACVLRSGV
jgi:type IV pilus assembly protein PilN